MTHTEMPIEDAPLTDPWGQPAISGGKFIPMMANMTLRDWFAGMAMQGLLAGSLQHDIGKIPRTGGNFEDLCAQAALKFADAMLAARKEGA